MFLFLCIYGYIYLFLFVKHYFGRCSTFILYIIVISFCWVTVVTLSLANSSIANVVPGSITAQLPKPTIRQPAGASPSIELEPDSVQLLLELGLVGRWEVFLHKVPVSNLQWDGEKQACLSMFVQRGGDTTSRGGANLHGGGVDNGVKELVILCHLLRSDNLRLTGVTLIVV